MQQMIRKIIVPQERNIVLELPKEFVGKEVEVLAFKVVENTPVPEPGSRRDSKEERLKYLVDALEPYRVDMSGYKFDRNEANNYD
jgi:hypothetical protein